MRSHGGDVARFIVPFSTEAKGNLKHLPIYDPLVVTKLAKLGADIPIRHTVEILADAYAGKL